MGAVQAEPQGRRSVMEGARDISDDSRRVVRANSVTVGRATQSLGSLTLHEIGSCLANSLANAPFALKPFSRAFFDDSFFKRAMAGYGQAHIHVSIVLSRSYVLSASSCPHRTYDKRKHMSRSTTVLTLMIQRQPSGAH